MCSHSGFVDNLTVSSKSEEPKQLGTPNFGERWFKGDITVALFNIRHFRFWSQDMTLYMTWLFLSGEASL